MASSELYNSHHLFADQNIKEYPYLNYLLLHYSTQLKVHSTVEKYANVSTAKKKFLVLNAINNDKEVLLNTFEIKGIEFSRDF